MGNWFLNEHDKWTYDENAPSASGVTALAPVSRETPEHPSGFVRGDGSSYGRADPSVFALFDEVDSTTIEDDGGPGDAA